MKENWQVFPFNSCDHKTNEIRVQKHFHDHHTKDYSMLKCLFNTCGFDTDDPDIPIELMVSVHNEDIKVKIIN